MTTQRHCNKITNQTIRSVSHLGRGPGRGHMIENINNFNSNELKENTVVRKL